MDRIERIKVRKTERESESQEENRKRWQRLKERKRKPKTERKEIRSFTKIHIKFSISKYALTFI